jgi:hypothetical protein
VLDRIEVDVVGASLEIRFAANRVLPIPWLPEIILAARVAGDRQALLRNVARECGLDRLPAPRKSESSNGKVKIACKWSGNTTMASTTNGFAFRTLRKAERSWSMWSTKADDRRSFSVTVKKYVPPGSRFRR